MKKCRKCNKLKPLDSYYKHKKMSDEHLNICISCTKKRISEREKKLRENPEWVEKEKERGREKYHRLGCKKPTPEMKKATTKRYNEKYPEKALASNRSQHIKVKIKGNNLHHWSYNKEHYKDVIELTIFEHNLLHRNIIYDQERMMYRNLKGELLDTKESHVELLKSLC